MLTELTQEQKDQLPGLITKWEKIGLSCEPADRKMAEEGIRLAYKNAKLEPPKTIIWSGSPYGLALGQTLLKTLITLESQDETIKSLAAYLKEQLSEIYITRPYFNPDLADSDLWNGVIHSIAGTIDRDVSQVLSSQVSTAISKRPLDEIAKQYVVSQTSEQILANMLSVRDIKDYVKAALVSVHAQVTKRAYPPGFEDLTHPDADKLDELMIAITHLIFEKLPQQLDETSWISCYGQHDANWLCFYDFFATACNLIDNIDVFEGLQMIAQSAGWWTPYKDVCFISERHSCIHKNEDGQIHCETGPAIAYPDGWSIWSLGGVIVDEQIVLRPETQTIKQIEETANTEIKRVRIERFGWARYLKESGAQLLDSNYNERDQQKEHLYQLNRGHQVIIVTDPSTGRQYSLGVPSEVKRCSDAQNWMSHGLDKFSVHRS